MSRPSFEDHVRRMLNDMAADIPAESDLTARIRHRQRQSSAAAASRATHRALSPRGILPAIAAVLVVTLLAATFFWFGPGGKAGIGAVPTVTPTRPASQLPPDPWCGWEGPPGSIDTPPDASQPIAGRTSDHGITITLLRAYADATLTIVSYRVAPTSYAPFVASLVDAYGTHYPAFGNGYADRDQTIQTAYFAPLPPNQLRVSQTLRFTTQSMQNLDADPGSNVTLGNWQVSFTFTPVAGQLSALAIPAATHDGLTIQPLRVEVAPPGAGLAGQRGGLRVTLRLSGLPANAPIPSVANFDTRFVTPSGAGSGGCGGGIVTLTPPHGQPVLPGFTFAPGSLPTTVPAGDSATVGPSGTLDVQILFFGPYQFTSAGSTLAIQHVLGGARPFVGPWTFALPVA